MKKSFILALMLVACNIGQVAAESQPVIENTEENLSLSLAESLE